MVKWKVLSIQRGWGIQNYNSVFKKSFNWGITLKNIQVANICLNEFYKVNIAV